MANRMLRSLLMSSLTISLLLLASNSRYTAVEGGSSVFTPIDVSSASSCDLGRATNYSPSGDGTCGYDSIPNFANGFALDSGVAPDTDFFFYGTSCGECYQLVGALGAFNTFQTNPSPVPVMVMDLCPQASNQLWCSGDMVHFDMRPTPWDDLTGSLSGTLEPFLFTYQKIACPLNDNNLGIYVVAQNSYYLSLRPFWHSIAVTDFLSIQQSGGSFSPSANRTFDNQYKYSSVTQIVYPVTVRVTAKQTGETIDITIPSAPATGDVYMATSQFSYSSITQSPEQECEHPFDRIVYNDYLHTVPDNPQKVLADYWRIYDGGNSYNLNSTAVAPASGSYCMSVDFSSYGTFQIAREIPVYPKTEVIALTMDLQASQATSELAFSFNGVGGSSGASPSMYPAIPQGSWTTYVVYMNATGIPTNNITSLYFQFNSKTGITIYLDNIEWILAPGESSGGDADGGDGDGDGGSSGSNDAAGLTNWLEPAMASFFCS